MSPPLLDLRDACEATQHIRHAAEALREGKVIALPTETVYGLAASAADESAVQRLLNIKDRPEGKPLAIALHSRDEAMKFVPQMSPLADRISKRCWPGPVTVVFAGALEQGAGRDLPPAVQAAVSTGGDLGLRIPAHWATLEVIRLANVPIALTSANKSGQPEAHVAGHVARTFDDRVAMVLDDGQSRHQLGSTVVRVDQESWKVLREGVVSTAMLQRLTARIILFICTGNTCRSPMAEAVAKHRIAESLGCRPNELEVHGYCVLSAGTSAMLGNAVSREAREALKQIGVEDEELGGQPLTKLMLQQTDQVWAMTQSHRRAAEAMLGDPTQVDKIQLLDPQGRDIPDPVGGSSQMYRDCAERIQECVGERLSQMLS